MNVASRRLLLFRKTMTPWLFLIFPLGAYLLVITYPLIASMVLSFTRWSGMGRGPTYIGIENFITLLSQGTLFLAIKNNLIWLALFVPVPTLIGFIIAYLLRENTRINIALRAMFYIPMIISNAVMAIMWLHVYAPEHGLIAEALKILNLPPMSRSLLTRPGYTIIAVSIVGIWHWIGFPLVIYLAAIQDIPQDLLEAAELDGATTWYKITRIIIPFVHHATTVVISLGAILSMKVFDLVYIMTGGYYKNDVMGTLIWRFAFEQYQLGRASAVAVIEFLVISVIVIPYVVWQMKTGEIEL
jgi:ABC-type sugar transport system permease subunit